MISDIRDRKLLVSKNSVFSVPYFNDHKAFGFIQDRRFIHSCKFYDSLHPNRSIIRYGYKNMKYVSHTDTD